MISEKDLYGIKHYLYGEPYFGSEKNMRFRLAREPLKNVVYLGEEERNADNPCLLAGVWYTPLSYENTPKEDITESRFTFDEDGFSEAVNWLNKMSLV